MAPKPGADHPLTHLTWADVAFIRSRAGLTPVRALARTYRVDPHTIRDILQRRTWWPEPIGCPGGLPPEESKGAIK